MRMRQMSEGGSALGVEKLLKSAESDGKIKIFFKSGDLLCYKLLRKKQYFLRKLRKTIFEDMHF